MESHELCVGMRRHEITKVSQKLMTYSVDGFFNEHRFRKVDYGVQACWAVCCSCLMCWLIDDRQDSISQTMCLSCFMFLVSCSLFHYSLYLVSCALFAVPCCIVPCFIVPCFIVPCALFPVPCFIDNGIRSR